MDNKEPLPEFKALIVAGGKGARFGSEIPKQYHEIAKKSVLRHSVDAFNTMRECTGICVVVDPNDAESVHETLADVKKLSMKHCGAERKDSVSNGLMGFSDVKNEEIILIHDAARPCISQHDIQNLLQALKTNKAATLAAPVTSTLRRGNEENMVHEPVSRDHLWALQTPQGFRYSDIRKAHDKADPNTTYTDDSALASQIGLPVKIVEGSNTNIKITMPEDLMLAEAILKSRAHA